MMLKNCLLLFVCVGIFATGECGGFKSLFHRKATTTEEPEEVETTTAATNTGKLTSDYYKENNIPTVEEDCSIHFICKKKLKAAENPKPCVKFCVKRIDCANGVTILGTADQCLVLNEELVAQEYNDCKKDGDASDMQTNEVEGTTIRTMEVAMIDFPCQPGYLPDSRGRCREVW